MPRKKLRKNINESFFSWRKKRRCHQNYDDITQNVCMGKDCISGEADDEQMKSISLSFGDVCQSDVNSVGNGELESNINFCNPECSNSPLNCPPHLYEIPSSNEDQLITSLFHDIISHDNSSDSLTEYEIDQFSSMTPETEAIEKHSSSLTLDEIHYKQMNKNCIFDLPIHSCMESNENRDVLKQDSDVTATSINNSLMSSITSMAPTYCNNNTILHKHLTSETGHNSVQHDDKARGNCDGDVEILSQETTYINRESSDYVKDNEATKADVTFLTGSAQNGTGKYYLTEHSHFVTEQNPSIACLDIPHGTLFDQSSHNTCTSSSNDRLATSSQYSLNLPPMRAMRSSFTSVDTLNEIHTMLSIVHSVSDYNTISISEPSLQSHQQSFNILHPNNNSLFHVPNASTIIDLSLTSVAYINNTLTSPFYTQVSQPTHISKYSHCPRENDCNISDNSKAVTFPTLCLPHASEGNCVTNSIGEFDKDLTENCPNKSNTCHANTKDEYVGCKEICMAIPSSISTTCLTRCPLTMPTTDTDVSIDVETKHVYNRGDVRWEGKENKPNEVNISTSELNPVMAEYVDDNDDVTIQPSHTPIDTIDYSCNTAMETEIRCSRREQLCTEATYRKHNNHKLALSAEQTDGDSHLLTTVADDFVLSNVTMQPNIQCKPLPSTRESIGGTSEEICRRKAIRLSHDLKDSQEDCLDGRNLSVTKAVKKICDRMRSSSDVTKRHDEKMCTHRKGVPVNEDFFIVEVCSKDPEVDDDVEVVAASHNTSLKECLEPILKRRGIDINNIYAFIENSRTPLPLHSDTSFYVGNSLRVKEKCRYNPNSIIPESMDKSRRKSASNATTFTMPSDQMSGGTLHLWGLPKTSMDDTRLSLSASLNDTLTYNESGKNKKSRMSVTNIFNIASSNREREKVDQLQEILSRYSNSELPRLPPLLALSRPQCVKECFQVETHWSALVTNASSLSKRQHNQQEAIWELLQTELSYIRHLRVIIDVFQTCLVNIQQEGLLCEIDLEKLLGNIDQIMELNSALWQEKLCQVLEDARSFQHLLNPSVMKSAFTKKFREFVKPYTHYCLHQKQCVSYMKSQFKGNELFRNFVRWAEAQKQCNRLKLADIQVKPMQRLTKYSLLLQAILRKTDNDFQRRDLLEMIASVDKYVGSINAQLQQHHELEKLEAILNKIEPYDAVECPNDSECVKIVHEYNSNFNLMAPMSGFHTVHHRRLLMHSNLRMKEAQIRADVDCFLFSDLILICKTNRRMEKFKIFRPPMRLDHIMVADLKDKGSFLLIYLNEYHVPSSVYTFHGDPCAVKVCLEKITSAQRDYRQQKLDDQQMHGMSTVSSSGDAEEVEYSPLPAQSLMPILSLSPSLLRLNSVDTSEDHFLPTVASDGVTMSSCCDRSDNLCFSESAVSSLQPNVDLSDFDTVHSEQHSTDLSHRKHPQCNVVMSHSVPNMTDMEAFMLHNVPDTDSHSVPNIAGTHAAETKDCIPPVHQHTEVVGVCDTESYPCTARCDDSDVESNRVYARRLSRCDKRHYTADSIPELLNVQRDSSIHKRLSWQDETRVTESSCTQVLSSESIHSSSGVSSVGSLYLHQESDISMDSETPRHHCRITLSERQCATVGTSSSQSCDDSDGASVKHLAVVFQSLQTGGREDGISSVSLEKDGNLETRRLSSDQLTLLKNKLLLDTDVEASEV